MASILPTKLCSRPISYAARTIFQHRRLAASQTRTITNATRPEYIPSVRKVDRGLSQPGGWVPSLMHSSGEVKFTVVRVPPGKEVPEHLHNKSWDYFMPLSGQGRITVYGTDGHEHHYEMRKDTFLAVPPGEGHVVRNKTNSEEFVFLIAQAPRASYDFVPQDDLVSRNEANA